MNWNNRELSERRDGPSSLDINTERWHEFREKCVTGQVFERERRMTIDDLCKRCRELLPDVKGCRVQVDSTSVNGSGTVDIFADLYGRKLTVSAKSHDDAFLAFRANVELLRFHDCEVKLEGK